MAARSATAMPRTLPAQSRWASPAQRRAGSTRWCWRPTPPAAPRYRPGATGAAIDQAARAQIEAGGYNPQFLHRTGHGLGLEIHEPPYIVGGGNEPLAPGATLYDPSRASTSAGLCGVRIEDDVVITADGAESLTTFERELIIVEG